MTTIRETEAGATEPYRGRPYQKFTVGGQWEGRKCDAYRQAGDISLIPLRSPGGRATGRLGVADGSRARTA
jgi:hypothetical protein